MKCESLKKTWCPVIRESVIGMEWTQLNPWVYIQNESWMKRYWLVSCVVFFDVPLFSSLFLCRCFDLIRSLLCGCPSLSWCSLSRRRISFSLILFLLFFVVSSSFSLFPHLCHNWWDIYIYVLVHFNIRNDCDTTLLCHRHCPFCSLFMMTRLVKKVRKGWQKRYANCLMKDKTKIRTEMIKDWGSKCKKKGRWSRHSDLCLLLSSRQVSSHAFHENHSDKDKEKEILVSCYSLTFILFPSKA